MSQAKVATPRSARAEESNAAISGLREQIIDMLVDLARRIEATGAELQELRTTRSQLERSLKILAPGSQPSTKQQHAKANGAQLVAARSLAAKLATMRSLIEQKPELFADGITATSFAAYWKERNLQPGASPKSVRICFEALRDEGVLRADHVVKGGGMAWKLATGGTDNA